MKYKNNLILFLSLISLPLFGEDFWTGVEQFRKGEYPAAAATLESALQGWQNDSSSAVNTAAGSTPGFHLPLAANLYCLSLIKSGRLEQGYKEFSSFYRQGLLDAQGVYNYAVAALKKKDFSTACQVASVAAAGGVSSQLEQPPEGSAAAEGGGPESILNFNYVAALASFSLENWGEAEELFKKSIAFENNLLENPAATEDSVNQALFSFKGKGFYQQYYLGLSQFRQGKLEASFATLESLGHLSPFLAIFSPSLGIQQAKTQGMNIALHCAVQLYHQTRDTAWWNKALAVAHQLMDASPNEISRQEAVLQAAHIYSDGGEAQRALELLKPYSKGRDELSLSCRMLQAELATSLGQLEKGIEEYKEIAALCSPSYLGKSSQKILAMGDRASYSRGELLYSAGKYGEAAGAFAEYRRAYPTGMYQDAALYFNGEALAKTGFTHEAILQHETLVKQCPDSPYIFSSLLELMDLYKETKEYGLALQRGNQLQASFFQQSQGAGVSEKMAELRLLEQGLQSHEASMLAEYQRVGEHKTVAGRKLAVELALFYGPSSGKEVQGEKLLLQILENYCEGEEVVAAQASSMLGDLYRSQNKCREAAGEFLRSAELYLKTGKAFDEKAATALYRGAESFDVAGMKSDSKAVAQELMQLFPKSQWALAAKIFL